MLGSKIEVLTVLRDLQVGDLILEMPQSTIPDDEFPVLVSAVRPPDPVDGKRWIDFDLVLSNGEIWEKVEVQRGVIATIHRRVP